MPKGKEILISCSRITNPDTKKENRPTTSIRCKAAHVYGLSTRYTLSTLYGLGTLTFFRKIFQYHNSVHTSLPPWQHILLMRLMKWMMILSLLSGLLKKVLSTLTMSYAGSVAVSWYFKVTIHAVIRICFVLE